MAKTRDYMDYLDDNVTIAPATSQEEYQAAETIANVLRDHNLETKIEEFDAHPWSKAIPPVLVIVMVVGLVIARVADGPVRFVALLLSALPVALALVSHFSGMNLYENLGPATTSQNVVAVHRAVGDKVVKGARPIVIVAHYDTPRQSLLRKGPLARYQAMLRIISIPCYVVVAISIVIQAIVVLPEVVRVAMWVIGIIAAFPLLFLAVADLYGNVAPCTQGSNDNKSSVAALLAIASKVRPVPDRVDGLSGQDAEKPRSSRHRANDVFEGHPAPQLIKIVEEVKGVRHGAEVMSALGILPPTCEVVYEEPRVQMVEQVATEVISPQGADVAADAAFEDVLHDEEFGEHEDSSSLEEGPQQNVEGDLPAQPEDYEEDYEDEEGYGEYAEEEDEGYEEGSYEDDEYEEEEAEEEYEDEDGEYEEDYEAEDYDGEEDDNEGVNLASVGSWFTARLSGVKDFFERNHVSLKGLGAKKDLDEDDELWDEDYDEEYEDDYEDEFEDDTQTEDDQAESIEDEDYEEAEEDEEFYAEDYDEYYEEEEADDDAHHEAATEDKTVTEDDDHDVSEGEQTLSGDDDTYGEDRTDEASEGEYADEDGYDEEWYEEKTHASDEDGHDDEEDAYGEEEEYDDYDEYDEEDYEESYDDEDDEYDSYDEYDEEEAEEDYEENAYDYEIITRPSVGDRISMLFKKIRASGSSTESSVDDSKKRKTVKYGSFREQADYKAEGDAGVFEDAYDEDDLYEMQEDDLGFIDEGGYEEAGIGYDDSYEEDYDEDYEEDYDEDIEESYYDEDDEDFGEPELDFTEDLGKAKGGVRPPDPDMLHFDHAYDEDIAPKDTSGMEVISDSYDLYTDGNVSFQGYEKPQPVEDPSWGVSTYQPPVPSMNIARRAALFDLPDPSSAEVDPLKDEYEEYDDEYEEYEETASMDRLATASMEKLTDAPKNESKSQEVFSDDPNAEQHKFWGTGEWKGGATTRENLRNGDDPLVIDADDLQDAILELGDDYLVAHDIWFVATGSSEYEHAGIKAFLNEHRKDIRGSFLINLDCIGAGGLSTIVREGLHAPRRADRRLVRMITGIAQDLHIQMDTAMLNWGECESATSMRSRIRSVTVAGLDENNLPALSHTTDDVPENVDPKQVSDVVRIITELIRRS